MPFIDLQFLCCCSCGFRYFSHKINYDRFSICNTYYDILSDITIVRRSSWCVGFQCEKLHAIIVSSVAAKQINQQKTKLSENLLRLNFFSVSVTDYSSNRIRKINDDRIYTGFYFNHQKSYSTGEHKKQQQQTK